MKDPLEGHDSHGGVDVSLADVNESHVAEIADLEKLLPAGKEKSAEAERRI